jgi:LysR family glycine cleavage system transcriptional activator
MSRKLPPLKALQSFEATARHLSFTAAAEELHVTPAAVGHQVRALEEYLGQKLLKRSTRQVEMTEQARWVLPVITQGLDLLAEAGERLTAVKSSPLVNLSVNPGFAARWLVQHLDGFHQQSPEWEVRLSATNKMADLSERQYDMGIRYGDGNYPGYKVHRLGLEEVSPVCAPTLMEGEKGIREPNDLRWHTLLHEDWALSNEQVWPSWRMWLRATGADLVDPIPGPHLSSAELAIQAAIAAQGVALSSTALIADDLKAGRLVRPFGEEFKTRVDTGYFLVYLEEAENEPKIVAFRDWLLAEYCRVS